MNKDKNIYTELEELSPFLAKMKSKKETVEMPENYFHYLENSVMQQVELENTPVLQTTEGVSKSLWIRLFLPRGIMGLASVVLLIVAGVYFNQSKVNTSNNSLQFAELTDTEILNYLADNAEVFDIYSLSEFNEETSILDMIDLEEGDIDYLLEENAIDIFNEEIF
ncbi:MAG: hypothetical protein ACI85O_002837 [Saprospiraceae bacterium]|jgi:hypothetical protein